MSTHAMRRLRVMQIAGLTAAVLVIAAIYLLPGWLQPPALSTTVVYTESPQPVSYGLQTGLPARATKTPTMVHSPHTALVVPTAQHSPVVTSPFSFPTSPPPASTAFVQDCTAVFPIESIEVIRFGQTTTAQLEAAFGHADSVGGRPTTYRFEERGCVLRVSVEGITAMEVTLSTYGTLDWLLDRYGVPGGVGISEGNLVLLIPGQTVLLFPDRGVIAVFDALPDDLTRATGIAALYVRPAYELERQIARLKLLVVDGWVAPLR